MTNIEKVLEKLYLLNGNIETALNKRLITLNNNSDLFINPGFD